MGQRFNLFMMEILGQLSTMEILAGLLVAVVVWIVAFILLVRPSASGSLSHPDSFPGTRSDMTVPPSRMMGSSPSPQAPWRVSSAPSLERVRSPRLPGDAGPPSYAPEKVEKPALPAMGGGTPKASDDEMKELKAKLDEALKIIRQSGL